MRSRDALVPRAAAGRKLGKCACIARVRAPLLLLLLLVGCAPRETLVSVVVLPSAPREPPPVVAPDSCEERAVVKIEAAADGTVDRAALDRAMESTRAYAQVCCVGGAAGTVEVRVEIAPGGWETSVQLSPASFRGGDTGACLEHSFQMVLVAPFVGPPVVYNLRAHLGGSP